MLPGRHTATAHQLRLELAVSRVPDQMYGASDVSLANKAPFWTHLSLFFCTRSLSLLCTRVFLFPFFFCLLSLSRANPLPLLLPLFLFLLYRHSLGEKMGDSREKSAKRPVYTLSNGCPAPRPEQSVQTGGNILLRDSALIDMLSHFNRERIPERVVHAKGAGAYGEFEVCVPPSPPSYIGYAAR